MNQRTEKDERITLQSNSCSRIKITSNKVVKRKYSVRKKPLYTFFNKYEFLLLLYRRYYSRSLKQNGNDTSKC